MRTAAAYISKLKAEALGRTFKVQDTNHRLFTSTLYRGAAGCGPVNFTQLEYVEPCLCSYLGPAKRERPARVPRILDGGSAIRSGPDIVDGGSVVRVVPIRTVIDGGIP
jgi:hypothetical protein